MQLSWPDPELPFPDRIKKQKGDAYHALVEILVNQAKCMRWLFTLQ